MWGCGHKFWAPLLFALFDAPRARSPWRSLHMMAPSLLALALLDRHSAAIMPSRFKIPDINPITNKRKSANKGQGQLTRGRGRRGAVRGAPCAWPCAVFLKNKFIVINSSAATATAENFKPVIEDMTTDNRKLLSLVGNRGEPRARRPSSLQVVTRTVARWRTMRAALRWSCLCYPR